jgi:flagellar biosynthesis protein FlhF
MPDETHLVMSATVAEPVLAKAAERFAVLKPTRVIFSKLDEAVHFGVIVNVLRRVQMRVSFVTTGQEVPDQIELAQADRLARLVLDGEVVR